MDGCKQNIGVSNALIIDTKEHEYIYQ